MRSPPIFVLSPGPAPGVGSTDAMCLAGPAWDPLAKTGRTTTSPAIRSLQADLLADDAPTPGRTSFGVV